MQNELTEHEKETNLRNNLSGMPTKALKYLLKDLSSRNAAPDYQNLLRELIHNRKISVRLSNTISQITKPKGMTMLR